MIVWGGVAIWVARDFYLDSITAAKILGRRALLLIGNARNMPAGPLPEGVAAFEYAPYSQVLPRACAVVHQGGVGTTGQGGRHGSDRKRTRDQTGRQDSKCGHCTSFEDASTNARLVVR